MHLVAILSTVLLASLANACFCPMVISNSCGCGGRGYNAYSGGGYGGGQQYSSGYNSGYSNNGGYAVFYRDLTPFRQPYYQQQAPAYQQYYPQAPPRQPQQQQIFQLPTQTYYQPQAAPPAPLPQRPQYVTPLVRPAPAPYRPAVQRPTYIQPAATVAPIPRTTLHDNEFEGNQRVVVTTTFAPPVVVTTTTEAFVTAPPTTTVAATVDEVPDFVDEPAKPVAEEKEEFYYVYYDDKGNKVGDSRSGTTYPPENVIDETSTIVPVQAAAQVEVTTAKILEETVNESYDDVVEESNVSERTTSFSPESITTAAIFRQETATVAGTDVIYEDETVEYEDEEQPEEFTKKPTNIKRTVSENQILVDAAETTPTGYRNMAKGVRIVKRYRSDARKIHAN